MKTEYTIVSSYFRPGNKVLNYEEFIQEVNKMLQQGWKCQGGISYSIVDASSVFINSGGSYKNFMQAMIREVR